MLKKISVIVVISLLVLSCVLLTVTAEKPIAQSTITGNVRTTGEDPTVSKLIFAIGETVYIFYEVNPQNTKVNIYIENVGGDKLYTVAEKIKTGEAQWVVPDELFDDMPIQLRVAVYDVEGNTIAAAAFATCTITITVVPESALGTIALIGATFAGFGLVKYRKNKLN